MPSLDYFQHVLNGVLGIMINTSGGIGCHLELLGLCCRRKMVRAPCCEKMGLKKGPWTPEEDQILVSYIQKYGHGNWRALPRQAGLLRCGKSCRLRWINYLRPDIKRGNFTEEEEETIIKLHELLGNRWSAIAARLPGRTDNEIKNVWHTHLKKRLQQNPPTPVNRRRPTEVPNYSSCLDSKPAYFPNQQRLDNPIFGPVSPQHSSSELSSTTTDSSASLSENNNFSIKDEYTAKFNENYCSDAFPVEDSNNYKDFQATTNNPRLEFPLSTGSTIMNALCNDESMDFWFNLLMETGSLSELPEIDVS